MTNKLKYLVALFVLGAIFLPFASGLMAISGTKYNDSNADGLYELNATGTGFPEAGLAGWTIALTKPDTTTVTTTTDLNGKYSFTGLAPGGDYMVMEQPQAGWIQSGPSNGHYVVNLSFNDKPDTDFGNVAWVSLNAGGVITTDPFVVKDYYGNDHIFARGSDNGLYDYYNGVWNSLGGILTSDPYPLANDNSPYIHILPLS
jgi:hypothetical protein